MPDVVSEVLGTFRRAELSLAPKLAIPEVWGPICFSNEGGYWVIWSDIPTEIIGIDDRDHDHT